MTIAQSAVSVPATCHPSTIQFQQGILLDDLCEPIPGKPLDYLFNFDPSQPTHRRQFHQCLKAFEINILGASPVTLSRIEPGFSSKTVQELFEALKGTEKGESKVVRDMEKADLGVSKSLEIERHNLDPSAVDENRKVLRQRIAALEDVQVKVETFQRRKADLWKKLFESLTDFHSKRIDAKVKEILPEMEKFNNQAKANNKHFQEAIAPKLRELHTLNPATPPEVYFTHLNMTELQIRQVKTLEAYTCLTFNEDRCESKLEVQPYARK